MISTITYTGRRFRRLGQMHTVAAKCIDDRGCDIRNSPLCFLPADVNSVYNSTPARHGVQDNLKRKYSSSLKKAMDKSGLEHHSLFQEQMLELEKEQQQFGHTKDGDGDGSDIIDSMTNTTATPMSADLEEELSDWKSEQMEVFGETLANHNESGPFDPTINTASDTELDSLDREDRFDFSSEDMVAWGKPNPDSEEMQKILDQVALEREREDAYAQSASLSPHANTQDSIDENSPPPPSISPVDHHESFSHVSGDGSSVHMVDVGSKAVTARIAHARSEVWLPPDVLEAFLQTNNDHSEELVGPKGPIFATAKIAGIMACKKTSDLIPLCHPLPLDQVKLDIRMKERSGSENDSDGGIVVIDCTCKVTHKTGVEMEALTGATVAALTIYDMTKAVSHNIRIQETKLIGKTGGKRTVLNGTETETPNR